MSLPSPAPSRTLVVDPSGKASRDCARSLEEAVARLIGDEYDTIVVFGSGGRDDVAIVEYLAGTWPEYLRAVTVRSVPARAARPR
jgi:hypothetical protein